MVYKDDKKKISNKGGKTKAIFFIEMHKEYLNIKKEVNNAVGAAGCPSQSFIDKCDRMIQTGMKKQYAFAIVFYKNGDCLISPLIQPHTLTMNNTDSTIEYLLHSEEILIAVLDHYFQTNGNNVKHVFIYTHYSPCKLRKEDNRDPCMLLLQITADQWHNKYGFCTEVVYKWPWGVCSDFFNCLQYSDIYPKGKVNTFFKPIIEKCDKIKYKLDSPYFKGLDPEDFKNEYVQSGVKKLKKLAKSSGLRKDHLEMGEYIIGHLEKAQDQDIGIKCKLWRKKLHEMVNNGFMILIRKTISKEFNPAMDYLMANALQMVNKGHFWLRHILDRNQIVMLTNNTLIQSICVFDHNVMQY